MAGRKASRKKDAQAAESATEAVTIPRTRAVEEGLLIVRSALTMEVKNRIIVSALRENANFDKATVADVVRAELGRLSDEQAADADRVATTRKKTGKSRGVARHQHDYRADDRNPLRQRELIYLSLSAQLARLRDDESFIEQVIEDARSRAWLEIGGAIETRLGFVPHIEVDDAYRRERDDRLRALLDEDLAELFSTRNERQP